MRRSHWQAARPSERGQGQADGAQTRDDHHVYDWIDEADIPKGTKIETSRCCDDLKPLDGDDTSVRSRVVVQQNNVFKREDVHQSTPLLSAEDAACVGHKQGLPPPEGVWNLGR